ncbi:hypothetical protein SCUCBS95973_008471 [Sporothrix curviconia]|uniref:Uncharacterized protein n=1 Tax=Sporothrix curviconia TaxID=1260050 RepID=A0ABP0CMK7_9PEZI
MGLVLYSSADGDPSPSCPSSLYSSSGDDFFPFDYPDNHLADLVAHNRHIPASRGKVRDWRCGPSKSRLTAKRQAAFAAQYSHDSQGYPSCQESEITLLRRYGMWRPSLMAHQVRLLRKSSHIYFDRWHRFGEAYRHSYMYDNQYYYKAPGTPHVRGQRKSVRDEWVNHAAADVCFTPASSAPRASPARRPPSLERQGAFRAASTAKKRMAARMNQPGRSPVSSDPCASFISSASSAFSASLPADDPDVAELYRLGLLYDDEHERGVGFGLDAIVHDVPLYTVSTGRRGRAGGREVATLEGISGACNDSLPPLHLALSFTNLGDDAALARFLQDEEMANYLAGASECAVPDLALFAPAFETSVSSSSSSSPSSRPVAQPVRVIYELVPDVAPESVGVTPESVAESVAEHAGALEPKVDTTTSPSEAGDSDSDGDYGDWDMDMDTGAMDDRQFANDRQSGSSDCLIACPTESDDSNDDDGSRHLDNAWVFLRR